MIFIVKQRKIIIKKNFRLLDLKIIKMKRIKLASIHSLIVKQRKIKENFRLLNLKII